MDVTYSVDRLKLPSIEVLTDFFAEFNITNVDDVSAIRTSLWGSHTLVTAYEKDKFLGVICGITDGFNVYISTLCVLPAYQKKGIGTTLLTTFMSECRNKARLNPAQAITGSGGLRFIACTDGYESLYEKLSFVVRDGYKTLTLEI